MSMDCTSCLTSPSCILGWLESENTAEVHTAVWESPVHPQALWTHTNRFKDNAVFIRARMFKKIKNQSKWPHSYPQPPSDRAQRRPLLQYEPLHRCYRFLPSVHWEISVQHQRLPSHLHKQEVSFIIYFPRIAFQHFAKKYLHLTFVFAIYAVQYGVVLDEAVKFL